MITSFHTNVLVASSVCLGSLSLKMSQNQDGNVQGYKMVVHKPVGDITLGLHLGYQLSYSDIIFFNLYTGQKG